MIVSKESRTVDITNVGNKLSSGVIPVFTTEVSLPQRSSIEVYLANIGSNVILINGSFPLKPDEKIVIRVLDPSLIKVKTASSSSTLAYLIVEI